MNNAARLHNGTLNDEPRGGRMTRIAIHPGPESAA
jgi:hypothetical protein